MGHVVLTSQVTKCAKDRPLEVAVASMGIVGIRQRTVVLVIAIQELAKVLRHETVATTVYKTIGERRCKGLPNLQLHTLL